MYRIYTVDVETSLLLPDRNGGIMTEKEHYKTKINERLDNLIQVKGKFLLHLIIVSGQHHPLVLIQIYLYVNLT